MSLNTVLKDDVQDILTAIRVTSIDNAMGTGTSPESVAFVQGYQAALEAVALALGLRLPSPQSLRRKDLDQRHRMYLQPSRYGAEQG
jgi:hypothetical protein